MNGRFVGLKQHRIPEGCVSNCVCTQKISYPKLYAKNILSQIDLIKFFLDIRHLVIGFLAFAGTLLVICVSLLVYSYSKRSQAREDSLLPH